VSGPTTTFPAFVDALKANLETRYAGTSGLERVKVFTGPVTPGVKVPSKTVVFVRASNVDRDPEAMPLTMKDEYNVTGIVTASQGGRSNPDGTETAVKAVRDECLSLLNVINDELTADGTQSGTVTRAHISRTEWDQGVDPSTKKRVCSVEFTIKVRARV